MVPAAANGHEVAVGAASQFTRGGGGSDAPTVTDHTDQSHHTDQTDRREPNDSSRRTPKKRRYTEQQFRDAVADPDVRTIADLCRALGIVPRGGNYQSVRAFARRHAVDMEKFDTGRPPAFTDEALRQASTGANSVREIAVSLGLPVTGPTHQAIVTRMDALGLDRTRFRGGAGRAARPIVDGGPKRTYTKDELIVAIEDPAIETFSELCSELGLRPRWENVNGLREAAHVLGVDLSHLRVAAGRPRTGVPGRAGHRLDDDELTRAVAQSRSIAAVMRYFGVPVTNGAFRRTLVRRIGELDLDISHMRGQGWSKGQKNPQSRRARPLEEYLVEGRYIPWTSKLRERLIREGYKQPRCEDCLRDEWYGHPIPLELDHVNGHRDDNRLENLRIRCPNCHALTATYRGRNIGNGF